MKRASLVSASASGLLFLAAFSGCRKEDPIVPSAVSCNGGRQYEIKEGKHYAKGTFWRMSSAFSKNTMSFQACFDKTAAYDLRKSDGTPDPDQGDINKLYGFTDCDDIDPLNDSARVGWRWSLAKKKIEVFAFTHKSGKFSYQLLGDLDFFEVGGFEISASGGVYSFVFRNGAGVAGKPIPMDRGCSGDVNGHRLFPYFGGDREAPHEINVWVKEQ